MSSACTCHEDPSTCWWCMYEIEKQKAERHEKTIEELDESLHIARKSRTDLLLYTKQLKVENERYEKALKYYANRGFNKAKEALEGC